MGRPHKDSNKKAAKDLLLEAAFQLIRTKGYTSTRIEEICELAGVTKGTFFHYFDTKEALAVAAAQHWSRVTGEFFKSAPYHNPKDPLDRFLGYIEFRKEILHGKIPEFTCLVGTMVQEAYNTHPEIRIACRDSIFGHAETLEKDIQEAKRLYAPKAKWSVKSLALHTQAVIQGSFILAKATDSAEVASQAIDHLKNYVQLLFNQQTKKEKSYG
ncbi:MAG: TetR family transcriptional regulator [Proteobacteria bacterium SG_bin7]|nr:MAG: TetR family transcriptional regulator [Proteobacteria bacterium SG_bin7]